jgi:hypothetical protein
VPELESNFSKPKPFKIQPGFIEADTVGVENITACNQVSLKQVRTSKVKLS